MTISLYECSSAHLLGEDIYCTKGHKLGGRADGKVPSIRLKRGEPLVYSACLGCKDFDRNGEPFLPEDRGWE